MKLQVSKLSGVIKNRKKEDDAMKKLLMGHIETVGKRSKESHVALENSIRRQIVDLIE